MDWVSCPKKYVGANDMRILHICKALMPYRSTYLWLVCPPACKVPRWRYTWCSSTPTGCSAATGRRLCYRTWIRSGPKVWWTRWTAAAATTVPLFRRRSRLRSGRARRPSSAPAAKKSLWAGSSSSSSLYNRRDEKKRTETNRKYGRLMRDNSKLQKTFAIFYQCI